MADPSSAPPAAPLTARPTLGGRQVDDRGVNSGLIRCPRCLSRLLSTVGELKERSGTDAILWVPHNATSGVEGEYEWTEQPHTWWWMVGGMDDVDNLGLSRVVDSPRGRVQVIMCCECNYGPFGYQLEDDPRLWLACNLLHQQDASLANDGDDFKAPANIDMAMLQGMIEAGMATVQYHVTFDEPRLGMCLADAESGGVEVVAFTDMGGEQLGPAELSGKVTVGDKLTRVNGKTTAGLDYAGVLDTVCSAPRPITIHFERKGAGATGVGARASERVVHEDWRDRERPAVSSAQGAGPSEAAGPG
jgi:hypothetical protein